MTRIRVTAAAAAAALALIAGAGAAQDLRVAVAAMTRSIDPHFDNTGPSSAQSLHLFDRLVMQDEKQRLMPGLATAWRPIGDRTWEFELRPNVTFHDGSPFTAADVKFTIRRALDAPQSHSPFRTYLNAVDRIEIVDPLRIRVHTKMPSPLLPWDLSTFGIVSRRAAEGALPADFNSGLAAVGTGPYRFVEYVPNERVVVERNESYWGGREPWAKVSFRLVSNPAVRSAALQAGDVDVIDAVAAQDLARLESIPGVRAWRAPSNRVIYLLMDSFRDVTPNVRDAEGRPTTVNPLRDRRVRQALSSAIARDALVERTLEGLGTPAGQLTPPGFFGHDPTIAAPAQDLELSRRLLAEAGWPAGFQLTLHGPSGRYPNDAKVTQAIAQMLARIGIAVTVETVPTQIFFTRGRAFDYSVALYGWGTDTGEGSAALKAVIRTRDPAAGVGQNNNGRYSNPAVDALIDRVLITFDDAERERLMHEATRIAMEDVAIAPLYFQTNIWATRGPIRYVPRFDEFTLAMSARPQ